MTKSDPVLRSPSRCLAWAVLLAWLLTGCGVHVSFPPTNVSVTDLKATASLVNSSPIPAGVKTLEVENYDGAIKLTGGGDGSFQWSQTVKVRALTDAVAQTLAKAVTCRVELSGDQLKLIVAPPASLEEVSFQSDFEISVPASVAVRTHNRYGPTTISSVTGPVAAIGESGSVAVSHVSGEVRAQTSYATLIVDHTGAADLTDQSGLIDASDIHGSLVAVTSYATLTARDISGPVKLRNQSGRVSVDRAGPADVRTSYAALRVTEIIGDATLANQSGSVEASAITGKVMASTSYATMDITGSGPNFVCTDQSGSIKLHASSGTLTNLEAKTSYASLTVWLSGELNHPAISAHTSYGRVESDFPLLSESPYLSPGTPRISLENQSGGIRVIRE